MLVEMRSITSIRPYENNPRLNEAAIDAVAASIKEFGFRQPLVVDEQGVIIVGHTRGRNHTMPKPSSRKLPGNGSALSHPVAFRCCLARCTS
jgi:hypothetical protein